ncbi:MAG: hypothetical protein MZV64_34965 [Ignavibacteriales bacterium]|nr:hypothetical protein [Ignavibacteriales bacterium]
MFLSHITSPTAIIFPVKEIIQRAREAGILTVIDGAHVAGSDSRCISTRSARIFTAATCTSGCARRRARAFLYARPEVQRPAQAAGRFVGLSSPRPQAARPFVDHHEWWGTRDIAAFLAVPKAIEFQEENRLGRGARVLPSAGCLRSRLGSRELTGLAPLHPQADGWFCPNGRRAPASGYRPRPSQTATL